ncbi:MAG: iron-containing alcohol dehydrogenase family protein [Lachnospiraceae bacterium]|jgi:phosphonate metabolism-associated iron-containing alcohol dehydrogenase
MKYYQPVNVMFGTGMAANVGELMKENGLDRALMIADPFNVRSGLAQKIKDASDGRILDVISDVEPNPSVANINACAKRAEEIGAKCVVAVGGGSAMDCAKSTAVAVQCHCTGADLIEGFAFDQALPVIAIPTTAGTGSEVTAGAVISDKEKGVKVAIFGTAIFPTLAIVDPELTYSCPPSVTSRSGIDVIAHALDAMTSVKANAITDTLAVQAAKLAFQNLERAVENGEDREARDQMSLACVTAGLAFSQTGTTGSHACSYILTSKYQIPHGEACAFTLEHWLRENVKVKPELETYAREIGFSDLETLCGKIREMKEKFGFKITLADAGISLDELDEVVDSSMASGNMSNNIAQIGREGVKNLFLNLR